MNRKGEWDLYTMECGESPHPALLKQLDQLRPYVLELLELDNDPVDRIEMKGVSLSYTDGTDIMGATLIASRRLYQSNTNQNVTTGHRFERYPSGQSTGDDKQLLPLGCAQVINALCTLVDGYIDGDRAQMTIADIDAPAESTEAEGLQALQGLAHLGKCAELTAQLCTMTEHQLTYSLRMALDANENKLALIIMDAMKDRFPEAYGILATEYARKFTAAA